MKFKSRLTQLAWFLPIIILPFATMWFMTDILFYGWIAYIVLWVLVNAVIDARGTKRWFLHLFLRSILVTVLFFVMPLVVFISANPSILTLFNTPIDGRQELRCVLNIETLPASVTNLHAGDDIWTDYIVHIYCELDPEDFPTMIGAIPFEKDELENPYVIGPPDYAPMPLFTAEETYTISDGAQTMCKIWTTKEHDRMYVYFGAD